MAIPSTNIGLANDIFGEANGGYSSGVVNLNTASFFSYFAGPNGSTSISYNAYGRGEGSGANRIFGTNAVVTPVDMDDFKGITYFYEQSSFRVVLNATNNLPDPPPPTNNIIQVDLALYDSSFTYSYLGGGSGDLFPFGGNYNQDISQPTTPIIFRAYWQLTISTSPQFGGGNVILDINGVNKINSVALNAGPTPNTFNSSTYGTADVAVYGVFTGLTFDVNCT